MCIRDSKRFAFKAERHRQRVFRLRGRAGVMELMPLVPDIVRQLVGNLFGIRLICFRSRHHDDAACLLYTSRARGWHRAETDKSRPVHVRVP